MKNYFLAFYLLLSLTLSAQMQTYTSEELLNDPNSIPNFELFVDILHMEYSTNNLFILGFGLGARGTIANKLKLQFVFNRPYTSKIVDWSNYHSYEAINQNLSHPKYPDIRLNQDFNLFNNFEISAGYIITDKVSTKTRKILLDRKNHLEIVSNVKTKERKRISLRAGYYHYRGIVDLLPDLAPGQYFLSTRGDKFYYDGVEYSDIDYTELQDVGDKEYSHIYNDNATRGWLTNISVNSIFLGFEMEFISNLVISTDKYGIRSNQKINKIYGDVFYGKPNVNDFKFFKSNTSAIVYGQEIGTGIADFSPKTGNADNEINTSNFGVRLGVESSNIIPTKYIHKEKDHPATKLFNLGAKIEIGYLPGVRSNFFAKLGIMLFFNK